MLYPIVIAFRVTSALLKFSFLVAALMARAAWPVIVGLCKLAVVVYGVVIVGGFIAARASYQRWKKREATA